MYLYNFVYMWVKITFEKGLSPDSSLSESISHPVPAYIYMGGFTQFYSILIMMYHDVCIIYSTTLYNFLLEDQVSTTKSSDSCQSQLDSIPQDTHWHHLWPLKIPHWTATSQLAMFDYRRRVCVCIYIYWDIYICTHITYISIYLTMVTKQLHT